MSKAGEGPFYMGPLVDDSFVRQLTEHAGLTPEGRRLPHFDRHRWAAPNKMRVLLERLCDEALAAQVPWYFSLSKLGLNAKRDAVVQVREHLLIPVPTRVGTVLDL